MADETESSAPRWSTSPTVKQKNAVQRCVTALLDELAPERVLKSGDRTRLRIEQHRMPTGCVLQAASAAVSVSWFADADTDAPMGALHILIWRGVVSRRGAAQKAEGAPLVSELVLHPVDRPLADCVWRATDGAEFDTASLAAHTLALLEGQIATTTE